MLKLGVGRRSRANYRFHEVFNGLSYPGTLAGRADSFATDLELLVLSVLRTAVDVSQPLFSLGLFKIVAQTFRDLKFFQAVSSAELEDATDTFNIFTGTLLTMFRATEVPDGEIREKVSQMLESPLAPTDLAVNDQTILLVVRCLLIFCLTCIMEAQYVSASSQRKKCCNMSLDTLRLLRETTLDARRYYLCPELAPLMKRLLFDPETRVVRFCYFDGPQTFYQNRYGTPLPMTFERGDVEALDPIKIYIPESTNLAEGISQLLDSQQELQQALLGYCDLDAGGHPLGTGTATGGIDYADLADNQKLLEQFSAAASSLIGVNQKLQNYEQQIMHILLPAKTSEAEEFLVHRVSTLVDRSQKRIRRSQISHRNPAGLITVSEPLRYQKRKPKPPEMTTDLSSTRRRSAMRARTLGSPATPVLPPACGTPPVQSSCPISNVQPPETAAPLQYPVLAPAAAESSSTETPAALALEARETAESASSVTPDFEAEAVDQERTAPRPRLGTTTRSPRGRGSPRRVGRRVRYGSP